jgi:hypothetical protein
MTIGDSHPSPVVGKISALRSRSISHKYRSALEASSMPRNRLSSKGQSISSQDKLQRGQIFNVNLICTGRAMLPPNNHWTCRRQSLELYTGSAPTCGFTTPQLCRQRSNYNPSAFGRYGPGIRIMCTARELGRIGFSSCMLFSPKEEREARAIAWDEDESLTTFAQD